MTKRHFGLYCLLLQSFMVISSEGQVSLRESTDRLDRADKKLSQSQEMSRDAQMALRNIYYHTPCYPTSRVSDALDKRMPLPTSDYHTDFPS